MDNNQQLTPNLQKKTTRKRHRKTVSDIDKQIKELQKKKESLILKSKTDIGEFVISTLDKKGISLEDIENERELFLEELETLLNENSQTFIELLKQ